MTSNTNKKDLTDNWTDTAKPDKVPDEVDSVQQQQPFPLLPRKRTKTKVLQVHWRTVMKEVISATYLIKDKKSLNESAVDLYIVYAKGKDHGYQWRMLSLVRCLKRNLSLSQQIRHQRPCPLLLHTAPNDVQQMFISVPRWNGKESS